MDMDWRENEQKGEVIRIVCGVVLKTEGATPRDRWQVRTRELCLNRLQMRII